MPISSSDFNLSISPNPVSSVVGLSSNLNLSFSNTSLVDRGYNLTAKLTIPNGVSYVTSDISPYSIENNLDGTITLTWLNIKDLAPNEINYAINVTLMADQNFRITGLPVPFDIPLTPITLNGTVDTLPRGNDDPGNEKITKTDSDIFIPLRYSLRKSAPGKMPKGAGTIDPLVSPLWPYSYTLTIENNSREPSLVTLIDTLPNGVRYLNNLSVSGPDSIALSSPNIIYPSSGIGGNNFTTVDWGSVLLSPLSTNVIIFDAAIWDNYTVNGIENSGGRILHLTPLQNIARLNGASGPVESITNTNAMDLTIDKSVSPSTTDVGQINNYNLLYRVNQYDSLENVILTDIISDGQTYNLGSASIVPLDPNPPRNPDGTTTLTWDLGSLNSGYTNSITFTTTTSTNYFSGAPVNAFDTISNNVNINGLNENFLTPTPDNSSTVQTITVPNINKQLLNYYYKDGSLKTIDIAAPGDLVEFQITYSSIGLTSSQRLIEIDEFAPLNMEPLTPSLPIIYGGTLGSSFPLDTISPNGLRWMLGTVPGNSLWTATFSIPVANIDFVGSRNNLAKLAGVNSLGFAYSDLSQVEVNFGEPNITLNKTVVGPNTSAIKAGEVYTYSITISNDENEENNVTDAFQMDLTDIIPNDLLYNGNFTITGTGSYSPPSFIGQNVSMTILKLAPGESLTLNYDVLVSNTVVSGKSYVNTATLQRPYSQPDRSYQFPGAPFTSSTTLRALGITMTKIVAPVAAKIGDIVNYLLQVTVPLGTTAYDVQVQDTFPLSTQTFITNSATKDGLPIVPTVLGNVVTFPSIPFIDATMSAVNILYAFSVRVVNGTHISPFIENQINNATVSWDLDNIGTPATPFNTSAILQVRTPNLTGRKDQRNTTTNPQPFTTSNLNYIVGDIIQYRITITNTGAETAFNSVINDTLSSFLSFVPGSITTTNGSASILGNIITWNIPTIAAGANATLTFNVTTLPGIGSTATIPNNATYIYNTNNNGFGVSYGPLTTNTVRLVSQALSITKTPSINQGEIGDDITYTITFTVPFGTIAYTPILTDTLPIGQSYIGPATRQENSGPETPVVPTVASQLITFPQEANIDASLQAKVITYKFIARITSATHSIPFTETQTNTSNINWGSAAIGSRVNRSATANVLARTPNITILKEQKNVSTSGNYTTSPISALPGDVIYYKLTITSNGASPAFNIILNDLLSDKLTFIDDISGPSTGSITQLGQSITWNIPQLNNGSTATYEFQVSINPGIVSGDTIPNSSTATYDSNDVNPIVYNASSNNTTINIPLLSFEKTANPTIATIGSQIDYTLTVTIPNGVSVTNLSLSDIIPAGQTYISGSFTATPLPFGTLIEAPNQLIYIDSGVTRTGPLMLIYNFSTTVINGTIVSPFTEIQRNICTIAWRVTPSGDVKFVSDFEDVTINVPNIVALKEQRLLPSGSFATTPLLNIEASDIVEYRITLQNNGTANAYNIVTSDFLDTSLTYLELTSISSGSITNTPNSVIWTIDSSPILPGQTETLIFKVDVNSGPPPVIAVINQSSSLYKSLSTNIQNLGPALSNIVSFNYTPPIVDKTVSKNALFVGNIVNYTVKITIPEGNIAYNLRLTDVLPIEQSYNIDSLRLDNIPITPVSTNPLISPTIPIVDATLDAITLTYTFTATINSITTPPQQQQLNTATLSWTQDEDGTIPGTPVTDTEIVYVTNNTLQIQKTQSTNINGPFTTDPIDTSVGSLIYYKLSLSNPNSNAIYNILSTDTFDSSLQILGFTLDFGAGLINSNNFTWAIDLINASPPQTIYNAIITALVLPGNPVSSTIPNLFSSTFAVLDTTSNISYGPLNSNTVLADLPDLKLNKSSSKSEFELGEILTYVLSVTIPKGLKAYNVVVSDTLPINQIFIGNATIAGNPVQVTQASQTITFPTQLIINENLEESVIEFIFDARIVTGNSSPPFTETQSDNATLNYAINEQGDPATPVTDTLDIIVNNPNLSVIKSQRNITKNSGFVTVPITIDSGDIIRYKLQAENSGASPAYNIIIKDCLNPFDNFESIFFSSKGTAVYDSSTKCVIWTIDFLDVDETAELLFDIMAAPGVASGDSTSNLASYSYGSNNTTPINFGPTKTNEVIKFYPNIEIQKTSNKNNFTVGQIITYTLTVRIPLGTIAYNVQITDTLPVGQLYNNNATLNGNPITASLIDGQEIFFPVIPLLDATKQEIIYTYTFEALVNSANISPVTFIETQTNFGHTDWFINPTTPANPIVDSESVNVTNSSIKLGKLQRNVSQGGSFTSDPINVSNNQTLEYSLTVTNTGPNTVYNLSITDLISDLLSFLSEVYVEVGTLTHSGEGIGGLVTWLFDELASGQSANAIFSVKTPNQPNIPFNNSSAGSFFVLPTSEDNFQSDDSNTTRANPYIPFIQINSCSIATICSKSCNKNNFK